MTMCSSAKKLRLRLWQGQRTKAFVLDEQGHVIGEAEKFCVDAWLIHLRNGLTCTYHEDEVEVGTNCWNCLDFVPQGQDHPECPHYNS